ncbi:MAG: endonuclease/exonuclease/phosphatase family protein [Flavobacteriales bacterium]|nr:endonuclease/exonuclease/phosphatase family protein [Flavobacteriales bacterium]
MELKKILNRLVVLLLFFSCSLKALSQGSDTLKILSWNIHMLPGTIYHATKKGKRANLIAEQILNRDDDVVVFQEAFHFRTRRMLKNKLKGRFTYVFKPINFSFFSFKTNGGVWVLSKLKLEEKAVIKFDSASGSSRWARKGAVLLEGSIGESCFQIVGTHTNGGSVNNSQFNQIRKELLTPFEKNPVPQIICGDLNCASSKTNLYEEMLAILAAKDLPRERGFQYSNHEKTAVIDYILLKTNGSDVKELNKKIILIGNDWKVGKRKYPETVGLSDHMPVESSYVFINN